MKFNCRMLALSCLTTLMLGVSGETMAFTTFYAPGEAASRGVSITVGSSSITLPASTTFTVNANGSVSFSATQGNPISITTNGVKTTVSSLSISSTGTPIVITTSGTTGGGSTLVGTASSVANIASVALSSQATNFTSSTSASGNP